MQFRGPPPNPPPPIRALQNGAALTSTLAPGNASNAPTGSRTYVFVFGRRLLWWLVGCLVGWLVGWWVVTPSKTYEPPFRLMSQHARASVRFPRAYPAKRQARPAAYGDSDFPGEECLQQLGKCEATFRWGLGARRHDGTEAVNAVGKVAKSLALLCLPAALTGSYAAVAPGSPNHFYTCSHLEMMLKRQQGVLHGFPRIFGGYLLHSFWQLLHFPRRGNCERQRLDRSARGHGPSDRKQHDETRRVLVEQLAPTSRPAPVLHWRGARCQGVCQRSHKALLAMQNNLHNDCDTQRGAFPKPHLTRQKPRSEGLTDLK